MTTGSSRSPLERPKRAGFLLHLKRNIGLTLFVLYGVGNILGAGIYVIIGEVAGLAGVYAPLSFLVAGLIAVLSALAYAEISVRFPVSAGEAEYVQKAFRSRALSRACGVMIALAGIVSAATIIRGFSGYARLIVDIPVPVMIALTGLVLAGVAIAGIKESALAAGLISLVEAGGLGLILIAGAPYLAGFAENWKTHYVPQEVSLWPGILLGAFVSFYAFIGFEDMVNIAEEVKRPHRNLPLGILLSLAIASILYMGVSYVAAAALPPERLGATASPLADLFTHLTGYPKTWFSGLASLAVINGALVQVVMSSRILYGMSQMKLLPAVFGGINSQTQTPVFSTVLSSGLILMLALMMPVAALARATSFIIFIVFFLVHLSLAVLRHGDSSWKTKGPSFGPVVPILGMVVSLFFLGIEILHW